MSPGSSASVRSGARGDPGEDPGFGVEIGGMNARAHEAEWTGLSIVPP